ncbi:MAG TPA: hypothetical protein VGH28_18200 [Polyangiaceae bacterium]
MRRKAVAVVVLALWPAACVLDWDSLKPDGGALEAGVDAHDATSPSTDGSLRDALALDAPADSPDEAAVDSATDAEDASEDAIEEQALEAGVDAAPDASEAGTDASADADADAAADADADAPSCAFAFTGTLATWDFTGQLGTETSVAAASMASGMTASAITRSSGLVAQSGQNSINASGWPTGALDPTRYFTITLTPPSACALDLTSLGIDTKASGTGPTAAAAATSADAFASTSTFTPTTVTNVSLSVNGATKAIEIRIYGYTSQSTQGTFRVENTMTLSGKLH